MEAKFEEKSSCCNTLFTALQVEAVRLRDDMGESKHEILLRDMFNPRSQLKAKCLEIGNRAQGGGRKSFARLAGEVGLVPLRSTCQLQSRTYGIVGLGTVSPRRSRPAGELSRDDGFFDS